MANLFVKAAALVIGLGMTGTLVQAGGAEDVEMGHTLADQGQFQAAIASYDKAIQSGDLDEGALANAHYSRGVAFGRLKQDDEALTAYREAVALNPRMVSGWSSICYQLYRRANYDEAIPNCDNALDLDPHHAPTFGIRALIWVEKGDEEKALADFAEAIEIAPNNFFNRLNRSRMLFDMGRINESREDALYVFKNGPDWMKTWDRSKKMFDLHGIK